MPFFRRRRTAAVAAPPLGPAADTDRLTRLTDVIGSLGPSRSLVVSDSRGDTLTLVAIRTSGDGKTAEVEATTGSSWDPIRSVSTLLDPELPTDQGVISSATPWLLEEAYIEGDKLVVRCVRYFFPTVGDPSAARKSLSIVPTRYEVTFAPNNSPVIAAHATMRSALATA